MQPVSHSSEAAIEPAASSSFDPRTVRKDFPVLQREVHGKPLVYLDNAATSQKPEAVIRVLDDYYRTTNANVHRGLHALSEQATVAYERAREVVAGFIGAPEPACVVFTRGTTEAINLVARSWAETRLGPGDELVISELEHHSNIVPWQLAAERAGFTIKVIPVRDDGALDQDAWLNLLEGPVKLVAISHVSNVLGTLNPVAGMIRQAHEAGAKVLIDGAQSVPDMPIDVTGLDCDFFAFSGHKMVGPTGIGALFAKRELLESMPPYQGGGEMIHRVTFDQSDWADIPAKFEAGTPHIAGAVGLAAAAEYIEAIGRKAASDYLHRLAETAVQRLSEVEGLRIYGPATMRGGAVSFRLNGVHPHDLSQLVDREGVAIRAGHMCCQPLMQRFNVGALSRASFFWYNLEDEIDALINALHKARDFFGHGL